LQAAGRYVSGPGPQPRRGHERAKKSCAERIQADGQATK
jgi:hypothetical protein